MKEADVRRWAGGVVACLMLAAGCSGADPVGVPRSSAPTTTPTTSARATPTTAPTELVAPLTGEPTQDEDVLTRPVLALKVDNHPLARPPSALSAADIVIEELVEGGVTRFIALYHSQVPLQVGPIRSGREVDADLLPAFEPVMGISGAASIVNGLLRGAGLRVFEEGQVDGFVRRPDLPVPHNLMVRPSDLLAAGDGLPAASTPWDIDEETPMGGTPTSHANVRFSDEADADWRWDGETESWLRSEDGRPHMDALGGRQSADTVVVVEVATRPGLRTDSGGNVTVEIDVIGEGRATVLRDGRAYNARWRKDGPSDQFEWRTLDGDSLPLSPGRAWIELQPQAGSLTLF